jgi:hypothetical protein
MYAMLLQYLKQADSVAIDTVMGVFAGMVSSGHSATELHQPDVSYIALQFYNLSSYHPPIESEQLFCFRLGCQLTLHGKKVCYGVNVSFVFPSQIYSATICYSECCSLLCFKTKPMQIILHSQRYVFSQSKNEKVLSFVLSTGSTTHPAITHCLHLKIMRLTRFLGNVAADQYIRENA